jgi:hypothetical protein
MRTNQRSATRETVADMSLPAKRNNSRIRTQPRWGQRSPAPASFPCFTLQHLLTSSYIPIGETNYR